MRWRSSNPSLCLSVSPSLPDKHWTVTCNLPQHWFVQTTDSNFMALGSISWNQIMAKFYALKQLLCFTCCFPSASSTPQHSLIVALCPKQISLEVEIRWKLIWWSEAVDFGLDSGLCTDQCVWGGGTLSFCLACIPAHVYRTARSWTMAHTCTCSQKSDSHQLIHTAAS